MNIAVLLKQVPDTWGERRIDLSTGLVDRGASDAVIDEICNRALEVALSYKDSADATVVVLTMGPAPVQEMLRKALAMGADSAMHVSDDALAGADTLQTAEVLAAALHSTGFDLVIAGNESTDGCGGVIPALIAERLGVPHASFLESVTIGVDGVRGERAVEGGSVQLFAPLPAMVSVTERLPEARFPSFKGFMQAKKKPLKVLTLADLDAEIPVSSSMVVAAAERPARDVGTKIVDEGNAARQIVEFLVANGLA
ncbi:electron transfer flavoprotein subunit beta/FixA family protein [Arthrobacter sp. efr-133-TYG-118]|uniref:electron transfer flavoprotein subunit beta/FixA family protein n=1 Tax=Arthrobacter sp. efr-133-TYG-118 TaxID=3040279 RepID=UPI002550968D|nr:electron transfer flavoprotein subunit beta/FixA family protein [Arthrobacter sp. efr-133-TYG-118]